MKKKRNFLLPLLMAIVMMAMSPTRVWAEECTTHTFTEASNGFCTLCGAYQPLGYAVDGWYEISNAGQLYSFAALANSSYNGSYSKARLTKDIVVNNGTFDADGNFTAEGATETSSPRSWTPIGKTDYFYGQFDGNSHTISGLYVNASSDYIGFIGYASGATIQKLGIVNGYFKASNAVGAICGKNSDGSTIQRCWSDSKVVGLNYIGGICGTNYWGSTVEDCYSSSTVSGNYLGGICGDNGFEKYGKYSSIINCYSTATVTDSYSSSICGINREKCPVTNCYAANDNLIGLQQGIVTNCEINVEPSRFASGEICYLLNGGENGKTDGTQAWYQKKDTDSYPVLKKATGNTIYCTYGTTCTDKRTYNNTATSGAPNHTFSGEITWIWAADGKSATASYSCGRDATHKPMPTTTITSKVKTNANCGVMGTTTYTASVTINGTTYTDTKDVQDIPATGNHTEPANFDDNGFKVCSVCHADLAYQPLGDAVDGWYEISNAGQLYSFAALANSSYNGSCSKARLTKDIVVNNGTFDADGNFTAKGATETSTPRSWTPIGNTKTSFFGQFDGDGHTISGLYYNATTYYIGFVGFSYGATIQKLGIVNGYFKASDYVGAICGSADFKSTIRQCWSDSKVIATDNYAAGICGTNYSASTVEDCYSSGTVSGKKYVGGISGTNASSYTVDGVKKYSSISNCYSTATVTGNISGSICGCNGSNCSVTNCYTSSDKLIGNQEGNEPVNCEINVEPSRFKSGEICYLLNGGASGKTDGTQAWYQKIPSTGSGQVNGDNYPVLKAASGNTVYNVASTTCNAKADYVNTPSSTSTHPLTGDITWTWTDDNKAVTATYTCQTDASHKPIVIATVTSKVKTNANCGVMGTTTYTASIKVNGTTYTDTKDVVDIPATGNHTEPADFNSNGIKECTVCHKTIAYQSVGNAGNGWYTIANAGQLISFAKKVNAGEQDIKGKLTADIDMQGVQYVQIGVSDKKPFMGELDGQYNAIKNLSITATANCGASLIGYADTVIVQRLTVQGKFTTSAKFAAGFIGQNINHISKIMKCISAVDIESKINGDGTHAGLVGVANIGVELSDCAFVGSITSDYGTNSCAGLIGWDNKQTSSATNCYVTATFTKGICEKQLMRHRDNGGFPTCYYLNDSGDSQGTKITDDQVSNGSLCYLLNGGEDSKTDGTQAWYQKLNTDSYPVLKKAVDGSNTVYYGIVDSEQKYSNVASEVDAEACEHDYTAVSASPDATTGLYSIVCSHNAEHVKAGAKAIKDYAPNATGAAKNLELTVTGEGESIAYSTSETIALTDDNQFAGVNVSFSPSEAPTYSRTMANEWGTLVLPFAVSAAPVGFEFYGVSSLIDGATLCLEKITESIAAGTPVFVRRTGEGTSLELTASSTTVTTAIATASGVALQGTYSSVNLTKTANPNDYFIYNNLLSSTSKLGDENYATVLPFHAYLCTPAASGAKLMIVVDGETTNIGQMENGEWRMENEAGAVFNLNGQKLSAPQKGINIINGRKVMVK